MKTIIVVWLCAMLSILTTQAQKTNSLKVPANVLSSFQSKFPSAKVVKWEKECNSEYEANFTINQKSTSANFDLAGRWVETETAITTTTLPALVLAMLKNNYTDFKIKAAYEIESIKNGPTFEVEIEKSETAFELLLTPEGKVLNKTTEK